MALIPSTLRRGLLASVNGAPRSVAQAAMEWATAYRDYAISAQAGVALWVPSGTEVARLAAALTPGLSPLGTAQLLAEGWANGVGAMWLAPPAVFGPGAVAGVAGLDALKASLTACFLNRFQSVDSACGTMTVALDAVTRTVTVAIPGVGVVPLS